MSAPNAALCLPPGDRDDAPALVPPERETAPSDAGRKPRLELAPETKAAIAQMGARIDEAQTALDDLKRALALDDLPLIKASAWRLSEALMIDLRTPATSLRRAIDRMPAPRRVEG